MPTFAERFCLGMYLPEYFGRSCGAEMTAILHFDEPEGQPLARRRGHVDEVRAYFYLAVVILRLQGRQEIANVVYGDEEPMRKACPAVTAFGCPPATRVCDRERN